MLLVQLGINSTRDVWKFCQIGLAPSWTRPKVDITPLLLIPNSTRQRMITHTYRKILARKCCSVSNESLFVLNSDG